ncbi:MAG TPA: DMT family transporter, partial [Blastocatellia bacterium]|nr:DMT family transporter [Blastocatellia bacterium]
GDSRLASRGWFATANRSERWVGRAQILLSTVGFGTIGIFAKVAYAGGVGAPLLLALRFLVACAALWAFFLLFNRDAIRIGRKELFICAALGLAGYGIFSTLTFKAFELLHASTVGPLFFSYPLFVILIDWVLTRERPAWQLSAGAAIIACGITVAVHSSLRDGSGLGLMFALGGAAWYAAYVVAIRRLLVNVRPQTVALYVTTFAAAGFWLMSGPVFPRLHLVTGETWAVVMAIGLVSTVMALLSFFSGLEKLGSAEASQIAVFELPLSLALSVLVLSERIGLPLMVGTGLILSGIVAGQLRFSERSNQGKDALCES